MSRSIKHGAEIQSRSMVEVPERQTQSAPPKQKIYSWPVTLDILNAHKAAGFSQVVLRNPETGEEAILMAPVINGGVCTTCGQILKRK